MLRNDAPNGLLLSVKHLKGIRILKEFQPQVAGEEAVDFREEVHETLRMKTKSDRPVAVTFGAGVTTQELNDALEDLDVFTVGPARGL